MNTMQSPEPENRKEQDSVMNENKEKNSGFLYELWDWTKSILLALVIVLIIHQFIFNLSKVEGQSMEPTLEENERLFINKIIYIIGEPSRGDVVILKDPRSLNQFLVKRVVAVAGDTVEVRNQRLFVNGAQVDEPYTPIPIEDGDYGPIEVSEGHYFVMGDNRHRDESLDSRSFGVVQSDLIKGKAEFILWPITKMGKL